MCGDILKYLSGCKQLTSLDLSGQDLSNQGKLLTEIMKNFGSSSLLKDLYLENCSIPEEDCTEMLKYLPSCKHLIYLNLSGNKVGKAGLHIAKTIENMGSGLDCTFRTCCTSKLLFLRNCSIPSDICGDILKYLSQCKQLTLLDLGGHDLSNQGKLLTRNYEELWI